MAAARLCPYCAEPLDAKPVHVEHPLPLALGSPLVIDAHLECGERLNREVDEPLLHCLPVLKMRSDCGIPDRRGRVPHPPSFTATDSTGARSTLRFLPLGRVDIRHRPHEALDEDGRVTVRFDHRESETVIKAKLASVRRRDPEALGLRQRGSQPGGYRLSGIRIPIYAWPRLAAKVGLAVGSLVADEHWLEGDTAGHLREMLWVKPGQKTRLALEPAPGDPPDYLAVNGALLPPEHFIWTSHSRAGLASVCMHLFSEWFLPVPLSMTAAEGAQVRDYGWVIDPRRPKVLAEGPLEDVVRKLERRRPLVEAVIEKRSQRLARLEREAAKRRQRRDEAPPQPEPPRTA